MLIKPRRIGHGFVTNGNGIVRGRTFPFTKCRARRFREVLLKLHIFRWNIVNGWEAAFEYAFRTLRLCNHYPIKNDFDMFMCSLQALVGVDNPKQTPVQAPAQYVFYDSQQIPFPFQHNIQSILLTSLTEKSGHLCEPLLRSTSRLINLDASVCYPHKRSMVSGGSAECRVTDLIQPLTNIFPEQIRRPRGDVGGNRSASPEPDIRLRVESFLWSWSDDHLVMVALLCVRQCLHQKGNA